MNKLWTEFIIIFYNNIGTVLVTVRMMWRGCSNVVSPNVMTFVLSKTFKQCWLLFEWWMMFERAWVRAINVRTVWRGRSNVRTWWRSCYQRHSNSAGCCSNDEVRTWYHRTWVRSNSVVRTCGITKRDGVRAIDDIRTVPVAVRMMWRGHLNGWLLPNSAGWCQTVPHMRQMTHWRIDAPRRTPYWLLKTYGVRFHVKGTYVFKAFFRGRYVF